MWPWATAVGCMIASRGSPPISMLVITMLSVMAIATSVYTYNDVTDIELDRLNHIKKNRAVPSEKISINDAMTIVYVSGFIGISLGLFLDLRAFLLLMLWMSLFLLYSTPRIRLKKRLLLKEGTVGTGFFICTIAGSMVAGQIIPQVIFAGVFFAAFVTLGFPAFRDTTDIKEDKIHGIKSLAVLLSWKAKMEMVILFVLAIMTLTPLTYVQFNFNVIFPILIVASSFIILRFLFPLLRHFEEKKFQKAYTFLFCFFVTSQFAFIFGSIPLVV
jgi:4-hydroxybenzoate polyprenyltransferase